MTGSHCDYGSGHGYYSCRHYAIADVGTRRSCEKHLDKALGERETILDALRYFEGLLDGSILWVGRDVATRSRAGSSTTALVRARSGNDRRGEES